MRLHELPAEVLLHIFGFLTPQDILDAVSLLNSRFSSLCLAPQLWDRITPSKLFLERGVDRSPQNVRKWYIGVRLAENCTRHELDAFVEDPSPELAWSITRRGPQVLPLLRKTFCAPKTIKHIFWSRWFYRGVLILRGLDMLKNPEASDFDLVIARYMLGGENAFYHFNEFLNLPMWPRVQQLSTTTEAKMDALLGYLRDAKDLHPDPLLRVTLFHAIAQKYGFFHTQLVSLDRAETSVYCCILDVTPTVFIDFGDCKQPRIRSMQDIQNRMAMLGVSEVLVGLSKELVFRGFDGVLGGEGVGAYEDLKLMQLLDTGNQYFEFVFDQRFGTSLYRPVYPAWEPDELVGTLCSITSMRGQGVVLGCMEDMCVVMIEKRMMGVKKVDVKPITGGDVKCTRYLGLLVPDINLDVPRLGFWFDKYDDKLQRFINN